MIHKCYFPGCSYSTDYRHQIHYHHIIPESMGGSDKEFNRIFVCPNHHAQIFVPNSKGVHSIQGADSIIIHGWVRSTGGRLLHYTDSNGVEQFV